MSKAKQIELKNEIVNRLQDLTVPTAVTGESFGTGDGSTKTFSGTLANTPVVPGSVTVNETGGEETFTDNGDGTLTGDQGGSGTINYKSGDISVTFNAAPAGTDDITADYRHGPYRKYTIRRNTEYLGGQNLRLTVIDNQTDLAIQLDAQFQEGAEENFAD